MATTPTPGTDSGLPASIRDAGTGLIDHPGAWLTDIAGQFLAAARSLLPSLLGAAALLLAGWLAALLLRWTIIRFGTGMDALLAVVHRWLGQEATTRPRWAVSRIAGDVVFWLTLAYVLSMSAEIVGLDTLAQWIRDLFGYLPSVLVSGLILFLGYLISNGLYNLIISTADAAGFRHAVILARLVAWLILAFTLLLALTQLGLDMELFADIILLAVAALFAGAALAFGIGAGDAVRNIIAAHFVRQTLRPGQRVRMEGHDGVVLQITPVAVILETESGDTLVPARTFQEHAVLILDEDGSDA